MKKVISAVFALLVLAFYGCTKKTDVPEFSVADTESFESIEISQAEETIAETAVNVPALDDAIMEEKLSATLGYARKSQYVLKTSGVGTSLVLDCGRIAVNGNIASDGKIYTNSSNVNVRGDIYADGIRSNDDTLVSSYHSYLSGDKRVLIDPEEAVIATAGNPEITDTYSFMNSDGIKTAYTTICTSLEISEEAEGIKLEKSIISDSDINLSADGDVFSSGSIVIFSKGGDISLDAENIFLQGVIYCPEGKVLVNAERFCFEGVIVADSIEIKADTAVISENTELPETLDFCYYNGLFDLGLNSHYATSDEKIELNWTTQFSEGSFSLYTSSDDDNYVYVDTVYDTKKYTYYVDSITDKRYFRLYHTLPNGLVVESEKVKLSYNSNLKGYILTSEDSDGDSVSDSKEYFSHTNPFLSDSDGDNLSDYQEIYVTGTDPLYIDSDEDGISDYFDDEDDDGIANYIEIKNGTSPVKKDTDGDTISDYNEMYVYGTSPVRKDSDGDTINDNDEIALGLDPFDTMTNGVSDAAFLISQTIDSNSSALKNVNSRNSPYTLTIKTNAAGMSEKQLVCGVSLYAEALSADYIVWDIIELSYSNKYPLESLDIIFTPDKNVTDSHLSFFSSKSEFDGIRKFLVFKYDEDKKMLLPCNTKYNTKTGDVYITANKAEGIFALVDAEKWLESIGLTDSSDNYVFSLDYRQCELSFPLTQKDSDSDGISDVGEVNSALAGENGYVMFSELCDMTCFENYSDGISEYLSTIKIIPLNSDPCDADTDNDMISEGSRISDEADYSGDKDPLRFSYRYYNDELSKLKLAHPDWNFAFRDCDITFDELVDAQYNTEWTSSIFKSSDYAITFINSSGKVTDEFLKRVDELLTVNDMEITTDNRLKIINRALDSGFTLITREGIEYYADPETYLNEKYIYSFMKLSDEEIDESRETLKELCTDSFYDSNVTEPSVDDYVGYMLKAGKEYGINPYYLAVKSFVEHGAKSRSGNYHIMIKGYPLNIDGKRVTVYNFGGIGANNGPGAVYDSAVYAYESGWTTPEKALLGMAEFTVKYYISRGQDNFYKQRFDIDSLACGSSLHQYGTATNMVTALSNNYSSYLSELLSSDNVTFEIPVFR